MIEEPNPNNIRLNYLYRDTSNYQAHGHVVFTAAHLTHTHPADAARPADIPGDHAALFEQLLQSLPTSSTGTPLFVPEQVDLPSLRHDLPGAYEDDTNWHEMIDIEQTSAPPTQDETFHQFTSRCLAVRRWEADPRIPHGTTIFDAGFHNHPPQTPQATPTQVADRWLAWAGDTWIAVGPDTDEHTWFAGTDQYTTAALPTPRVRPIDDTPALGRLIYREQIHRTGADHPELIHAAVPTPGHITITAEQIRRWTGHALDTAQLHRLSEAIEHSTIPDLLRALTRSITHSVRTGTTDVDTGADPDVDVDVGQT